MIEDPDRGAMVLDLETLAEMADVLGPELFSVRLEAFRQELVTLKCGLEVLQGTGKIEELGQFAHKLAGGASIFGAERLHAALAAIDGATRGGETDRLSTLIEIAGAVGERSQRELSRWEHKTPR